MSPPIVSSYLTMPGGSTKLLNLLQLPVATDHVVRGTVMAQLRLVLRFQLRDDLLGENLAEFDTPLIERINVPNCALREDAVFVESDKLAQSLRSEPLS